MLSGVQRRDVDAWGRLGRAVRRARIEGGHGSQDDFALLMGVSGKTLGTLENGRPVGEATLYAVERALGWPHGRVEQLLEGVPEERSTRSSPGLEDVDDDVLLDEIARRFRAGRQRGSGESRGHTPPMTRPRFAAADRDEDSEE